MLLLLLLSRFSRVRLCDPIDSSPPGSPVPGILQARTLEWVAISFSNAWNWKVKGKSISHVRLLATPWTAAYQAPLSMVFSRQEYWSGVALPSPRYTYTPSLLKLPPIFLPISPHTSLTQLISLKKKKNHLEFLCDCIRPILIWENWHLSNNSLKIHECYIPYLSSSLNF